MASAKDFRVAISMSAARVAGIEDKRDRMSSFLAYLTGAIESADKASARAIWQVLQPGTEPIYSHESAASPGYPLSGQHSNAS